MKHHYYGGDKYPWEHLAVNTEGPPDEDDQGRVEEFYDYNNTYWRASDLLGFVKEVRAEGKVPKFINLETDELITIETDGLSIWSPDKKNLREFWVHENHEELPPEQAALITHANEYVAENSEI